MTNPWQISHAEFLEYEVQFITLKQPDGFISGEQARNFFIQSGLPPQTLGQVRKVFNGFNLIPDVFRYGCWRI
jgi:hypothetical protein